VTITSGRPSSDADLVSSIAAAAADSTASACARWREVAAAWKEITTETRGLTAPTVPDTRDLIVRLGRLFAVAQDVHDGDAEDEDGGAC
jgi:hypothetical protein